MDTKQPPTVGQVITVANGGGQCKVISVGKPLASGRFQGMNVVVVNWSSTSREGSFIAQITEWTS